MEAKHFTNFNKTQSQSSQQVDFSLVVINELLDSSEARNTADDGNEEE